MVKKCFYAYGRAHVIISFVPGVFLFHISFLSINRFIDVCCAGTESKIWAISTLSHILPLGMIGRTWASCVHHFRWAELDWKAAVTRQTIILPMPGKFSRWYLFSVAGVWFQRVVVVGQRSWNYKKIIRLFFVFYNNILSQIVSALPLILTLPGLTRLTKSIRSQQNCNACLNFDLSFSERRQIKKSSMQRQKVIA